MAQSLYAPGNGTEAEQQNGADLPGCSVVEEEADEKYDETHEGEQLNPVSAG